MVKGKYCCLHKTHTMGKGPFRQQEASSDDILGQYCAAHKGSRPISRVLIANNGLAAVKKIRSVRRWAYETFGDDRVVKFVVMATPDDLAANSEFIRMADDVVSVPGGSNNFNYANVAIIVDTAVRYNVQVIGDLLLFYALL